MLAINGSPMCFAGTTSRKRPDYSFFSTSCNVRGKGPFITLRVHDVNHTGTFQNEGKKAESFMNERERKSLSSYAGARFNTLFLPFIQPMK
jgi:hypothetical protein